MRYLKPLLSAVLAAGLSAPAPAGAFSKQQKDLKIAECISRHLNEKFIQHRSDTDFGVGVIADPHCNDEHGFRTMSRMNIWHAESLDLTIIVGDLSISNEVDLRKYVAGAPKNFKWPYTGAHVTVQAGKQVKRTWPDKPRAAPPCVLAFGNHEVHFGKRYYVETLYPGAVTDASLWIHDPTHYANKQPAPNGNGNYVFFSFNYGKLHFVALDAWGMGRGRKLNVIPPHELKWLEANLQAHRQMETVVLNHSPVAMSDPSLQLQNRLQLMAVLKKHPQVKWYFSGHHHGYAWAKWAHINVFKVAAGEAGRYGSGALLVEDAQPARWRVWDDHYWYAPAYWKNKEGVMYHRVLTPDKPAETIKLPIPELPVKADKAAPGPPGHLRLRKLDPKRRVKNSLPLQWDPADGADYYDIHRDRQRIGGSLYPYFTDYDRKPDVKYQYTVYARDIAGNQSAAAATGSFSAPDAPVRAPSPKEAH